TKTHRAANRYGRSDMGAGFENTDTESLLVIQSNLLEGLGTVARHFERGTQNVSKKEGAAPPSQSGWLTLMLLVGVEDELESRVRGFQRAVDPKLLTKTL